MAITPVTVRSRLPGNHYPRLSAVEAAARAMGCEPSTAGQYLKLAAPECPFTRTARITEALLAHGHGARADGLLFPLDLVRQAAPIGEVSLAAFREALEAEQVADGAEDVAQLFVSDRASYATWRRRVLAYHRAMLTAVRIGDALWGS